MKTLPLKKTTYTNFAGPIKDYFRVQYPEHSLDDLDLVLKHFQRDRDTLADILQNPRGVSFNQILNALDVWLTDIIYLQQHVCTEVLDSQSSRLIFQWTPAFTPSKTVMNRDLSFDSYGSINDEITALLYNFAAVHCSLGFSANHNNPEHLKDALKQFKKAYAIFEYIKNVYLPFAKKTSAELSESGLTMLIFMTSAQVQACIYEKGVTEKISRTLLSKLANEVSIEYTKCIVAAEHLLAQSSLPDTFVVWLKTQEIAFKAAAHFQRCQYDLIKVQEKSEGYGPLLARLKLVEQLCEKAQSLVVSYPSISVDLTPISTKASQLFNEIDADNRIIYLEIIPPAEKLPSLERLPVTSNEPKSTNNVTLQSIVSLSHVVPTMAQNVFAQFVPSAVVIRISEIKAHALEIIAPFSTFYSSADSQIQTLLETYDSCWDSEQIKSKLLTGFLWEKIQSIKMNGDVSGIFQMVSQVKSCATQCETLLSDIETSLKSEETANAAYRQQYGALWRGVPSPNLNQQFFHQFYEYKKALEKALVTNSELEKKIQATSRFHLALTYDKEKLAEFLVTERNKQISSTSASVDQGFQQQQTNITEISQSLTRASDLVTKLGCTISDLKTSLAKYLLEWKSNLTQSWLKHTLAQEETDTCTAIFESLVTGSSIQRLQDDVSKELNQIKILAHCYQNSDQTPITELGILQAFKQAVTAISEAQQELKAGISFFKNLVTYSKTLKVNVDNWLHTRQNESYNILKEIGLRRQSQIPQSNTYWSENSTLTQMYPQPYSNNVNSVYNNQNAPSYPQLYPPHKQFSQ